MNTEVPSRTLSQIIWVSIGRFFLVGTWFAATILIGRVLGVVGFGIYVYCQTAIKLVTGCVGDPLDMAVMRRAPLLLKENRPAALQLIRSAFWLRVLIGAVVLLAIVAVPPFASQHMFGRSDYQLLVILTAAGVLGDFLLRSALGFFQIGEQFRKFMAVDSVWQGGRVVAVLTLVLMHRLTPVSAVGLYVIIPYAAFVIALLILPNDVRRLVAPHAGEVAGILHYGKWIVIGMAMTAAYERLDILLLQHFKGEYAVGLYGAAMAWAVVPDFINGILQTVLAPKIAPAYAEGKFNAMQKSYLSGAIPVGVLFLAFALPIAGWVIRIFMSADFSAATNVYRILILSTVFNTVFTPLPEALMNFVAPKRVTFYSAIGLAWVAIAGVLLIPRYGPMGAAWVMLVARIIVGTLNMIRAHQLGRATI